MLVVLDLVVVVFLFYLSFYFVVKVESVVVLEEFRNWLSIGVLVSCYVFKVGDDSFDVMVWLLSLS